MAINQNWEIKRSLGVGHCGSRRGLILAKRRLKNGISEAIEKAKLPRPPVSENPNLALLFWFIRIGNSVSYGGG